VGQLAVLTLQLRVRPGWPAGAGRLPLVNAGLSVVGVAVAVSGAPAPVRALHGGRVAGQAVE
jgi:hypothetical protein